ncbi:MAG: flavin reductase [Spirochaetales bacterium]|nr:flavin reductase [Spirochaetales bacterium]
MDAKALFNISYGIFMLATKDGDRVNGCITNTCMQVANAPTRIAIACINRNLTCEMLKSSGVFTMSILDQSATFETVRRFGLQSGRKVDKFADFPCPTNGNGIPYLPDQTCAVISAHVVSSQDLGSHTLFIAEVDDAVRTSDLAPLTYNDYQNNVKPKPAAAVQRKIVGWRCRICGYEYKGETLPADFICPLCGHDVSDFEPIYEN